MVENSAERGVTERLRLTPSPLHSDADMDRLIERLWTFKNAGITEIGLRLYDEPADSMHKIADVIGAELH